MSPVKAPLRKNLNMTVEKQAQKRQETLGQKPKHCSCIKTCIILVASNVEQFWSQLDQVMCKRRSSISLLILEINMCLKCNHRMWSLSDALEANMCRQNESKSLMTKKSVNRTKVEKKFKELNE